MTDNVLTRQCPQCGKQGAEQRNPVPTVDILILLPGRGIVLIERRHPPHGWAIPGGFIDAGETAEQAAVREAREETGLEVVLTGVLGVYSDPRRDPRLHTMSVVYTAVPVDPSRLEAGDDAGSARVFPVGEWPSPLAFDHGLILDDYLRLWKRLNQPG
jgi:8-oxo-dGTP diphosphatase